jgi:RHS repeat-associated protein
MDTRGLVPVIKTQNGNVTYYDVLAPNGPINNNGTRVRYTVTSATVPVATNFQQSDVYDWISPGILNPVQSISLPDGSQYTFTYDSYGELASVTLPTGGVIQYGYTNFVDSSNTANRWLSSRTQGSNLPMTFTPSVVTTCPNYSTGCVESVKLHKPSGDETVYQLTLINGAWNTGVTTYTGQSAGGQTLSNITSVNQYTNGCSNANTCSGGNYLSQSLSTTVLYANGSPSVSTQTQSLYNSAVGKLSAVKEWDYGTDFNGTPTRETDYSYTGVDIQQVTVLSNGNAAGQTTYGYTSTSDAYLRTISHWLNTGSPSITRYTLDHTGQVVSTSDPNGNPPSTISYQCANSLPYQTTNALNQTTTYGYDCNSGAMTSVRDPNDAAAGRSGTTYSYEGTAGRLQSVNSPDGGQTTYGYPSSTEVDATVLATPSPSISSQDIADSFGRKYQHIQAGVSSETTYDANGRVACVTNPHFTNSSSSTDGSTCITSYDGLDRPLVQQQPDGNTLQWSYPGNSTTSKDEAGNQWVRTSNAFGLLTNVVEPTGASTNYAYDGLSNLSTVTQLGVSGETRRVRSFVYDSLSRLTSEGNPESGATSFIYDANGNVQTNTDNRGVQITYTYDALNRITRKQSAGGNGVPGFNFGYGYDGYAEDGSPTPTSNSIGRLSHSSNEVNVATNYFYNPVGRVTGQIYCIPSDCSYSTSVNAKYDLAGNITSLTYPDGRVVTQGMNAAGQLQSVTFDNWNGQHVGYTYASNFTYTPSGAQAEVWYGNGVYIHTPYNNRQQMCQVWSNSTEGWIDTHIYYGGSTIYCNNTPGNNGNITQIKDWKNPNRTQNFVYDNLNRLSSFSNGDGSMQQSYTIDSFGNMSTVAGGVATTTFDLATNRINSLPCAASVTPFDAAGNQLCDTDANGAVRQYGVDADNHITQIAILGNTSSPFETYTYDANGGRVRKTNANGTYTEYVYFNGQPLAEKNSDGTWSDYIYANGQKIARADSYDVRIHFAGTNCSNCGATAWAYNIPVPAYTIQSGDKIAWRQYQTGPAVPRGGLGLRFSDGTYTNWVTVDQDGQVMNDDTTQNAWHYRVADLSQHAGKTIAAAWINEDSGSGAGNWEEFFSDIAFFRQDGTVQPIYNRQANVSYPSFGYGGVTNLTFDVQTVPGLAVEFGNNTTYYIGDQLGSTRLEFAGGGWPVSSNTFYPFGQEQTASADTNHYKFTGQERDSESNLDYFKARHYSFTAGRFMSPDPYNGSMDPSNPQSFNRYSYVGNNPLGFTDPTGLTPIPCAPVNGVPTLCDNVGSTSSSTGNSDNGEWWDPVDWPSEIFNLFTGSGPKFQGSLKPRPDAANCGVSASSLDNYLGTKNSPMVGQGTNLMNSGAQYNLDPRLLVSLAGAETGFGNNITAGQFNAFNVLYHGLNSPFASFQSAINSVGHSLTNPRNGYDFTNTATLYGHYCSGNCSAGLKNLNTFMNQQGANTNSLHYPCKKKE